MEIVYLQTTLSVSLVSLLLQQPESCWLVQVHTAPSISLVSVSAVKLRVEVFPSTEPSRLPHLSRVLCASGQPPSTRHVTSPVQPSASVTVLEGSTPWQVWVSPLTVSVTCGGRGGGSKPERYGDQNLTEINSLVCDRCIVVNQKNIFVILPLHNKAFSLVCYGLQNQKQN